MITRFHSGFYSCLFAILFMSKTDGAWAQDQTALAWPIVENETLANGLQSWTLSSDAYQHSTAAFSWNYKRALGLEKAGMQEAMARCISAAWAHDTLGTDWTLEWEVQGQQAIVSGPADWQNDWGSQLIQTMVSPNFEVLWPQVQATWLESWSTEMTQPLATHSRVSQFTVFGAQHPFGEIPSFESISNITWEDLRDFHSTYWRPNNATVVFATPSSSLPPNGQTPRMPEAWSNAFNGWISRSVEASSIINPPRPRSIQAAIIDRPTDSLRVSVSHVIRMKPDHPDALGLALLASALDWDAWGCQLATDEIMGTCHCHWIDAAEELEDHIQILLATMRAATEESITELKLDSIKSTFVASIAHQLQQPATAAEIWTAHPALRLSSALALDSALESVTNRDIRRIAINYLRPNNLQIVVQGNRGAAVNALTSLVQVEDLLFFDTLAQKLSNYAPAPPGLTAEEVIDAHYEACGGVNTFESLQGLMQRGTMTAGGSMVMNYEALDAYGIGHRTTYALEDQIMMEYRIRMSDGISFQMGKRREMTAAEFERYQPHLIADYLRHVTDWGFELELVGSFVVEGNDAWVVEMRRNGTLVQSLFFDAVSGLLIQSKEVRNGPTGPVELNTTFGDYAWFEGIRLPRHIAQLSNNQQMSISVEEVKLNPRVDKAIFAWE